MVRRRGSAARRALSADGIVEAALRVARAEGIGAVSMRRLADELGISAMSPYRHVADRQDLILRMLDVVAARLGPAPVGGPPRDRVREITLRLHASFQQDAWLVQVLATEGLASPLVLPLLEALYAALAEAGLSVTESRQALALLLQYTYGEVLMTHHDDTNSISRRMVREADPDRFPHLTRVAGDTAASGDFYQANLDRILTTLLTPTQSEDT